MTPKAGVTWRLSFGTGLSHPNAVSSSPLALVQVSEQPSSLEQKNILLFVYITSPCLVLNLYSGDVA